ncbi:hypothetical protein MBLNU457_1378t1 [Dothideomycetes sp. NU457]
MAGPNVAVSSDPFDSTDYNPIDHLNALFSTPSSLSSVRRVSSALRAHQDELDRSIRVQARRQRTSNKGSVERIQGAQSELGDLFEKISSVQTRAHETERNITEMTAEIKRLDATKRNLTHSMTALKRLQMLTSAYEQLRVLKTSRQYRECASLLAAVLQLMAHFKSYRSIEQIAALSKGVADTQREILEQVCEDFELAFAKSEVQQKRGMLNEACGVMDALGEHARQRLINWYCNTQLREYRQVFRGSEEAGSLDNIGRRYSWFNRMLKTYDTEHAMLFPPHWRVNEQLANAFCEGTREDYKGILQKQMRRTDGQPPDVNLLLSCLQETLDFEHSLEKRFAIAESRSSLDTVNSEREQKPHGFSQAISEAFEPYLSIWVESQDKQLAALIPKYRQQPIRNAEEEYYSQMVIASSTELFHSYRVTFAQCAKLSTGGRLLQLSKTFAKNLDAYSQQVLFHLLSERSGSQGPSIEDIAIILNTADYCYQTTNQLEERIKSRIDEEFKEQVDLQSQADAFMGICSAAVRTLVRKVEIDCESAWREMRNVAWSKMESVGDQSPYITSLIQRTHDRSAEILSILPADKGQYARAFCDHLVDATTSTFVNNLVACRPISETAAEQLLLDSYALKKALLDLPTSTSSESKPVPTRAFSTRVNTAMSRLDPLLKTLQVRAQPPEGLVQAYLIHIHDRSEPNFRKLLELKGISRKAEQAALIELFNAHKESASFAPNPSDPSRGLAINNPAIGNLSLVSNPSVAAAPEKSSALSAVGLGVLSKDSAASHSSPAIAGQGFGEKLISAARDGVDRFGSPSLGSGPGLGALNGPPGASSVSATASRATSPPPSSLWPQNVGGGVGDVAASTAGAAAGGLNENLKSIGKFFRRDVGSFGGFGRRAVVDDGGSASARASMDRR